MVRAGSFGEDRPVERVIKRLVALGKKVERRGRDWTAQCPAHDDRHASLSIGEGTDGRALLTCHTGCDWRAVVAALGLEAEDLFPREREAGLESGGRASARPRSGGSPTATGEGGSSAPTDIHYDYRDAAGSLLYQVVRSPEKQFRIRRPAGGGWAWGLGSVVRVPYNLPAVSAAPEGSLLFVVEGEKDVETLRRHDLLATTNLGGAGKWRDEYSALLQGKRVVVLPDNDPPGRAHAEQVLGSLAALGIEAARLELPDLPPKGDVSDWLAAGGTAEELLYRAERALVQAVVDAEPLPSQASGLSSDHSDNSTSGDDTTEPAPLGPEAFYGIAGEVVRAIEPHTEADPAALLLTLLTGVGSLIGPGPYAQVEATRHRLNLFVALVGQSAKARKGTSEDHVRSLLRRLDPEWEATRVQTGISSGEGLIYHVRDAAPAFGDGKPDEGVEDKRLWVIEGEFAQLLKVMNREGNTVSPILRCAWDGKTLQTLTRNSPLRATGAYISLLAHATREELRRYLNRTEAGNGFGNRFLWGYARRSKCLPFGGGVPGLEPLVQRLQRSVAVAGGLARITWSEPAARMWTAVYERLSAGSTGLFGAVTSRAEAQVLRLATLYAALEPSRQIQPAHLLAGLALWEYCEASARYLFDDAVGDKLCDPILTLLRQSPKGLSLTQLHDLLGNSCPARALRAALQRLQSPGLARCERHNDTGGRPVEIWIAAPPRLPKEAVSYRQLARAALATAELPSQEAELAE